MRNQFAKDKSLRVMLHGTICNDDFQRSTVLHLYNEYVNENEISILSRAHAFTSVIVAGKRDSRRHSLVQVLVKLSK